MFYHDNMNGPMYENGQLSHNWDPDRDFPENSHIKVYFRIDAIGFDYHGYFNDASDQTLFYQETKAVLSRFGLLEDCGYTAQRESVIDYLYIHPQNISGTVRMRDVKPIAEALDALTSCSVRWVDVYEEVFDMDEKAFLTRLEAQKQAIKADLLRMYETKRCNLLIVPSYFSGPEKTLANKYHIARKTCQGYDDGTAYYFITGCRDELILEGKIAKGETKNGTGYRTVKQNAKAKKTA